MEVLGKTLGGYNTDARSVDGWNRLSAASGAQCALNLPAAHKVDLYPIQVAF